MQYGEPDLDSMKERFWEMYLLECHRQGLKPSISGFQVWLDEQPEGEVGEEG